MRKRSWLNHAATSGAQPAMDYRTLDPTQHDLRDLE